jgi:hypothetical protein
VSGHPQERQKSVIRPPLHTAEAPHTTNADLVLVINQDYIGMVSVSLDRNVVNFCNLAPGDEIGSPRKM